MKPIKPAGSLENTETHNDGMHHGVMKLELEYDCHIIVWPHYSLVNSQRFNHPRRRTMNAALYGITEWLEFLCV